jgi:hypothetical protein
MPQCPVPTALWGTVTIEEPVPVWEDAPPRPMVAAPPTSRPAEVGARPWTVPSSIALPARQLRAPPRHPATGAHRGGGGRTLG